MTQAVVAKIGNEAVARESRTSLYLFAAVAIAAVAAYFYHLGAIALGGSEAYSALAVMKPRIADIFAIPLNYDPGRQVGFYIVLHFWTRIFGTSEFGLRSMSAFFSIVNLALMFAIGRAMFDDQVALESAAVWGFSPWQVTFAHRARMYPLFIAVALGHVLTLWRLRERPTIRLTIASGVLGAALLYSHLGSTVLIGAEIAMLARDFVRGRRDAHPWIAIAIAIALFAPLAPFVLRQGNALLYGQALDWIAPPYHYPLAIRIVAVLAAALAGLWFVFGSQFDRDSAEPLRWLFAWVAMPMIAFELGSILVHPMFTFRYVSPSVALCSLMLVAGIGAVFGARVRNLTAFGYTAACLIMLPFAIPGPQPWPEIVKQIESAPHPQPVFFEGGYASSGAGMRPNDGYPFGYYSVPFGYYFHGTNPKIVVPGWDPEGARAIIEAEVTRTGGGWLVSWKDQKGLANELPDPKAFNSTVIASGEYLLVLRILPIESSRN